MIARFLPLAKQSINLRNYFATATLDQINYYNILGVSSGATQQQINQAYNERIKISNPLTNTQAFKQLSQAFVILSNSRSRDAYDSLLKSQKVSYLNDAQQVKVSQKSYIAQRRQDANHIVRKKMNIDQFGRYKGGLPRNIPYGISQRRGNSANNPGQFATRLDVEDCAQKYPQYNIVDTQVAQSFKELNQLNRRDRMMRTPWFNMEVDYDFFTFKTFRLKYLPWLRLIAVFGFALPILWVFVENQIRLYEQRQIRQKKH